MLMSSTHLMQPKLATICATKIKQMPQCGFLYTQTPAKRSQHFEATYRNIVALSMLRAFGRPLATGTISCSIHKCCI